MVSSINTRQLAPTVLLIVNELWFFRSHRLPIARALVERGYDVHIAGKVRTEDDLLKTENLTVHNLNLDRGSRNPLQEIKSIIGLTRLIYRLKPQILHLITIKPIIYGGILARILKVPAVVIAVSGLGYVFLGTGPWRAILRQIIVTCYRSALRHRNLAVICQNPDDALIVKRMYSNAYIELIKGSGVDLKQFPVTPEPETNLPIVVLAARMLKDKGIFEFVEAARSIASRNIPGKFLLVGDTDPSNPTSISEDQLSQWSNEGFVDWVGFDSNVAALFERASIVVLPSYREGLPKVLIEAAAAGRPCVTTDVPGCRDAIIENVTGLLVPPKNSAALADAISELLSSKSRRAAMGMAARNHAEDCFSIENVVERHLEIYSQLLNHP